MLGAENPLLDRPTRLSHHRMSRPPEPLSDPKRIVPELLDRLIKPFVTNEWWEMTLPTIEELASHVPCYELYFDRNGGVVELIEDLLRALPSAPIQASTTADSSVIPPHNPPSVSPFFPHPLPSGICLASFSVDFFRRPPHT